EVADCSRDLCGMRFQCKVSGVEEADDRIRNIALECLSTRGQEERIVLAPHSEELRLMVAEILLESRIERNVALVVSEQVELQIVRTRPGQIKIVERVAVWRNGGGIGDAVGVLPDCRLGCEEGAESFTLCRRGILPIGPDWAPTLAQAFLISIAVLGDDCG